MARRLVLTMPGLFGAHGGIARFDQMLCRAIDELAPDLGLQGTVVAQHDTAEDYDRAGRPWSHLEFVPASSNADTARKTIGRCWRERPELLVLGLMGYAPVAMACLPALGLGFGFIAHGIEVWDEPRWTRRLAARRARFSFAVSRHTTEAVHRTAGLPRSSIYLLHNTLDPGFEELPWTEVDEPEGAAPELLTVSRLDAAETMKGVDRTLEAFARVREKHPTAVYRIVGRGTDKPRLQKMASDLGLDGHVIFEQDLSDEDLAARYRDCTFFVMPSGQEGFGIVFLEAMRFARPCIGGNAGGTPDVVVHDETGLLVPFGDQPALELALDSLLSDRELRKKLGRAGRRRLEQHFTFASFKKQVGSHLESVLS